MEGGICEWLLEFEEKVFSVTHIKQYGFTGAGGERIAEMEVRWTLEAKRGEALMPEGMLECGNFRFVDADLETRRLFAKALFKK